MSHYVAANVVRLVAGSNIALDPPAGLGLVTVAANVAPIGIAFKPGDYQLLNSHAGTPQSSFAIVQNELRALPFAISRTSTLVRLGITASTTGQTGALTRIGIYADDDMGHPGKLVIDAGTVTTNPTGSKEITVNVTLTPGVYWAAVVCQNCPTSRPGLVGYIDGSWLTNYLGTVIPAGTVQPVGVYQSGVSGALPTTFTVTGAIPYTSNGDGVPRVFAKGN